MKIRLAFALLLIMDCVAAKAQRYDWAAFAEVASGYANGSAGDRSVARDNQGNFIITGDYSEAFVSGTDTIQAISLGNGSDVYVAKYSPSGVPIWITGFGGSWYDNGYAVATDASGNIFVAAYVQTGNTTFPDTVISNLHDSQVSKFDADGNYKWTVFVDGPQKGCVTVSGNYIYYSHNNNSITKIDEDGNIIWDKVPSAGSGGAYLNELITAPNGDILASGITLGLTTFTYDTFTVTVASGNGDYGYYIRLDTSGNTVSMASFGPTTTAYYGIAALSADAVGNVYLGCTFTNTFTFGSTTYNIGAKYYGVVLKYDASGNPIWADTIPSNQVTANANYYDAFSNHVYIGGSSDNSLVYSNGISLPDNFNGDGYLIEFDATDGAPLLASQWGEGSSTDVVFDFAGDANGILYGAGWDYGGSPVLRCKTYNKKSGAILFAFSHGSDAISINIIRTNDTLFADPPADYNQWFLDGDTIPGATGSSLLMTENGTYSVVSTNQYGCSATDTISVGNVGILNPEMHESNFAVYPNPANNTLIIERNQLTENTVEVVDLTGRTIFDRALSSQTLNTIDVSDFAQGVYYIRLISSNHQVLSVKKFVVVH